MSVSLVKAYLAPFGLENRVREFDVSSATVELAAQAVGVIPARITKTLSFLVGDSAILVACAGDTKVDNHKFKERFGCKAKMLNAEQVIRFTGHAIGGVCPFALPERGVKTYLDVSMRRFETVFPAAGSANSAVELTCEELERCADRFDGWVDVCKGWENTSNA